jgi:hypothetical protein
LARLGRTLRAWRSQLMAYFVTERISNGGTEAINLIIEKTRRLAHGFRNFGNYRLRLLLVADGRRPLPETGTSAPPEPCLATKSHMSRCADEPVDRSREPGRGAVRVTGVGYWEYRS